MKIQPFQVDDGYSVFINLTDTPSSYTGEAGKTVIVSASENALEFGTAPGGGLLTDGYLLLEEQSAHPSPVDGNGIVYTKEVDDGYTEFHYADNYGISTQITDKGSVPTLFSALWEYPENPHSLDDEFEDETLSGWAKNFTAVSGIDPYAKFSSGDVRQEIHTAREKSWYLAQPPANATLKVLKKAYTLPTNTFVWMRARFMQRAGRAQGADARIMVGFSSSTGGIPDEETYALMFLNSGANEDEVGIMFETDIDGVSVLQQKLADVYRYEQGFDYVGVHKIGDICHGWAFNDAGQAVYIGKRDFSGASNIMDYLIVVFTNISIDHPGNAIMGVDFVRVVESATFLPGMHR